MSSIVLKQITKQYGDGAIAVNNVSFEVEEGTFTVLLGPSGCGKSTTLRMIAGLDTPTSGRILIGGQDVTDLPSSQRRISMVFQSYALFPHLSVKENILFGLRVRKEPASDYKRRLDDVAELLGLQALLDRKPSQLSGGQQQRVALGRAVISQAPVCLMDEPLSNLDAQLRHDMRREIRALQQTLGITMMYVTHDQTEAMSMADNVVLLNGGCMEQNDSPAELYRRPATEFSARFIGTPPMNLINLEAGATHIAGCPRPLTAPMHQASKLGVRPEHITLGAQGEHAFDATITNIEYFGADSIVVCQVGHCDSVTVRAPGHVLATPGDTTRLAWDPQHQHFFDSSGTTLST